MSVTGIGRIAMADKMSVDQLKEALQNKTLPAYIAIPLIEEKMDMRDRMMRSQAMQGAAQQKAPIGEEILARTDAGIDQLPTGLPATGMAGGGIVAFEDGGEVGEPVRFQNTGLVAPSQGTPFSRTSIGRYFDEQQEIARLRSQLKGKYERLASVLPGAFTEQPEGSMADAQKMLGRIYQMSLPELRTLAAQEGPTAQTAAKPDARIPSTAVAPSPAPAAPAPAGEDKSLVTGAGASVIPGQGLRLPAPPTTSSLGIVQDFLEGTPDKGTGERVGGYFQRSEDREKRLMDALGKDRIQGKAFEGYEAALKKEGEQAGLDKTQAKYMAMLKAGLSMMAGTSRHALENIGKGALLGVEDYQVAYKDLRKAERERMKEFSLIEQARRAEARDDLNRRDQLLMRASDAAQKRDDFGTQALLNAGVEDARTARDIWKTQYAGGVQLGAAQIRANALGTRGTGLTAAQLGRFRQEAMRQIDQNALRAQIAKELKLNKVPAPGADKSFDDKVNEKYNKAINDYVQRILGEGATTDGISQRYSLIGTED